MKQSLRTTILLLTAFVVLLGWYLLYEKKIRLEQETKAGKEKKLISLEKDQVQLLTISILGNPSISLKKTGDTWYVTKPVEDLADNGKVQTVLTSVTTLQHERVVDEKPEDLALYGLNKPGLIVTVQKDSKSPAQTLELGNDTHVGHSIFVKIKGRPEVLRTSRALKRATNKTLTDLRNKNIVQANADDVTELEVRSPKGTTLLKKKRGAWFLLRSGIPAVPSEVNKLLNKLTVVTATGFAAEDEKHLSWFGLNQPKVTATLTLKEGKKKTLKLSELGSTAYAIISGKAVVYEINKDIFKDIIKPTKHYQSRELVRYSRFNATRVTLQKNTKTVVELLKNKNKQWEFPTDLSKEVDSKSVDKYLGQLQDYKITKYHSKKTAAMGLDKPQFTVRIFEGENGDKEMFNLTFGKRSGSTVFVKRSNLDLPFQLKWADYLMIALEQKAFEAPKKPTKSE